MLPGPCPASLAKISALWKNYRLQSCRSFLTLRSTTISQSIDANGNGVPDDDPRVPMDEKRFGWQASQGGDCLKRLDGGFKASRVPRRHRYGF